MEQHPIPQQISSYEFKLVGDMTLKQFIKAAGGIILAILINTTSLIVLVKWPLMFICGGGGLLLAFVPFEDRPLETWVLAFIKSIYSPTIYIYKKRANKNWLEIDSSKVVEEESDEDEGVVAKKDNSKVKEFIESLPSVKREADKVEIIEERKTEGKTGIIGEVKETESVVKEDNWRDQKTNLNLKTEKLGATGRAVFGSIPMPDIPEVPNVIVGMTTNNMDKIIDGVIIEIQDEHGNPTRVLKTNSLGQFRTSTPLVNGRYLIICEKEGFNFDRVNIDLRGEIVKPIRIITAN